MSAVFSRQPWLLASLLASTLACGAAPESGVRANQGAGSSAPSAGASGLAAVSGAGGAPNTAMMVVSAGQGGARVMGSAGVPAGAGAGGIAAIGGSGGAAIGGRNAVAGSGGAAGSLASVGIDVSQGWVLTVYHTPVESFHSGAAVAVTGCAKMPCMNGKDALGSYAGDFVQAVKDEGTGRITSGNYAGKYLNWSMDIGYWLDDAARDARGQALIPWVSAASDPKVPFGTHFMVADCGVDQAEGTPIDRTVCMKIEQASWSVNDRFEVGSVGAQFDLYIGEEDRADFDNTSPYLITTAHAQITLIP